MADTDRFSLRYCESIRLDVTKKFISKKARTVPTEGPTLKRNKYRGDENAAETKAH